MRFVLNDQPVELADVSPMTTLLDWLRDHRRLKGTKEGCAEGDCGACTVVLERADGRRAPINACIALLGQVDGLAIRTVEGLSGPDGGPHPVQTAMAEADATQCGFCTPGFVMSAYAFAAGGEAAEPDAIHEALAGNLCRCTGYRPIVAAFSKVAGLAAGPSPAPAGRDASVEFGGAFLAPRSLADLLAARAARPAALLLAGGTDLGLLASRARRPPAAVIHVAHVPELAVVTEVDGAITVGGAVTYADALPLLSARFPPLRTYLSRLGSRQIRTMGTLGGNIGTASPIGDMPPVLLALGATLRLVSLRGARTLPLEDFFLDYRKTALAPDEVIQSITIPTLAADEVFFCDKVTKRRDQDISAVAAGYRLRMSAGRVDAARLAFGGMAAIPRRAPTAEAALLKEGFAAAAAAVSREFQPLDDWRGSAAYRRQVAANLLRRLELRLPRRPMRWRSRRCEGRRPYRAAPRQRAEARDRPGDLHRRHCRAAGHAACRAGPQPGGARPAARPRSLGSGRIGWRGDRAAGADIPGENNIAGAGKQEPLLADDTVEFLGQPLAMVVAQTLDAARAAAERAVIDIEPLEAILDIPTALARQAYVQAPSTLLRGDVVTAMAAAPHRLDAAFSAGGQEHFYLEGQIAFALPGEDGDLVVHSSTQHPTEVQHVCAHVLGCDFNRVTTVVRRLGGGFGGKESNATWVAAAAALVLPRPAGRSSCACRARATS